MTYSEPQLSVLILDMEKPVETTNLLDSLDANLRVPHRRVYLHNGRDSGYAYQLYRAGRIDQFMQSKVNTGLGVGTRDLFATCFTKWALYMQNDQTLARPLDQGEFDWFTSMIGYVNPTDQTVKSVSLAGAPCGKDVYSERAHLIETSFYRSMEHSIPLPNGGAGPHHHEDWRESTIQAHYRKHSHLHLTGIQPCVRDEGRYTIRDLPCGGRLRMRTDTKSVVWLTPPKESYVFPEMDESEWELSIKGEWPAGRIPEAYLRRPGGSFNCWGEIAS